MASTSASQLDKLLKETDVTQQQKETLDSISEQIDELIKKGDKLSKADAKRIGELKEEIVEINKTASIERRKEISSIIKEFQTSIASIKGDWVNYSDDVKLSYLSLESEFQDTMAETQVLVEEKLTKIGEVIGSKINIAAQFVGTKVKDLISGALNAIENKINTVFSNLGGSIKSGFLKLKNALTSPFELIKSLPGRMLSIVKSGIMMVYNGIKGLFKLAYNVIVGAIRWALVGIVKIFKGIVWVVSKMIQGLYWLVKQTFYWIYKGFVKVFSFLASVVWSLLKTVGSFIVNVMWKTIKTIASTVAKVAWTLATTLVKTIVTAVMTAFAPWLGILLLVGLGVYFLGKYFGWWGGGPDSKPNRPEKGGIFSAIFDVIDEWWKKIKGFFWNDKGDGVLQTAFHVFWNKEGNGLIQTFFGLSGDFFTSLWNKLTEFGNWLLYGPKEKTFADVLLTQSKNSVEQKQPQQTSLAEVTSTLGGPNQTKVPIRPEEKFQGITKIISNWWETSGLTNLTKWWIETAYPTIVKWFFGNEADPQNTGGVWGWIKREISSNTTFIKESISELITGEKIGGWGSPKQDSLLGKFYEIIFGKFSIDWGTSGGLIGLMKEIAYTYIVNPVIEFVQSFFEPFVKSVFSFLGRILGWVSKDAAEKTQSVGRGVSEAMGGAATKAAVSGAKSMGERSEFFKGQLSTSKNAEEIAQLTKNISSIQETKQSFESKIKEAYTIDPGEKFKTQKRLVQNYAHVMRYLYSLGINNPQSSSDWLTGRDGIKTKSKNLLNSDVDIANSGLSDIFNVDKGLGFDLKTIQNMYRSIIEGKQQFPTDLISNLKSEMSDLSKKGYFSEDVAKSYNTILSNIRFMQIGIKHSYDMALKEAKKGNIPGIWSRAKSDDELKNSVIDDIINNLTDEYRTHFVGFSKLYKLVGEDAGNIDMSFGFAMGGIIKPPTAKADMGRIITVAEAGNPEVVLPLNAEGIKYIRDISESLQPVKEDNVFIDSLMKMIEDKQSIVEKKESPLGGVPRILPGTNVKNSDSTNLDLIKLVSLGVLSK